MTTFDKFRNYNTWPQNIPLEQAQVCWDQIKENVLKNILGLYHVEWQKLYTVKFQVQTYVEDQFKQIVEIKQFHKQEFQKSQDYIKRMLEEISSISRNKQEIINEFKKQNQNNFQELLSQWEINKILFEDVNILQNLNIKLKSDKKELISKYEEIQKHQLVLHQQIQEYQNLIPQLFSDYKNSDQQYSFDHIQASIKNVTNQSEALLELAREIIQRNQIPQNDSSAGLLNLFMKTLIYNNQFLMKVSQTLRNYWTQLIRIQEKNQALEREILSKTEEIAQIKIQFDQNQKEFELLISASEERMTKLQPQDYNSHFNKQNPEPENPQNQVFRVKLYEQVECIQDLGLESLTYSVRQATFMAQISLEIANYKDEMIRSLQSQLEAQTNELLAQQEISNIFVQDVERLRNLNTVLTSERNDLIQLYKIIQEDQRRLNEELLQYKTRNFRDRGNHLQQIQADILNVIGSSVSLIGKIDNILIQSNQRNTSEELLQERLKNLKQIFTYNNRLLLQLSQQLQNSETYMIRIRLQNERLQKEILQKTQEIEQIKTEFQAKSQEFMQQCRMQAEIMKPLKPLDYDSHKTKSKRIERSLNNMKNHFCEFGCNLFLRILNDCQTQIQAFNNQELETLLLDQIKELQKISNLEQQEKLLQGNLNILAQFNNSETLVINRDILKEVQNMLQNIRSLQEQVNTR